MSIFGQLMEKPWLADDNHDGLRDNAADTASAPQLALRVILAVVTFLFFLLTVAYGGRLGFEDVRPLPQPWLLWQNTIMLILASVTMQWARYSASHGAIDGVRLGLYGGGAFTVAFIIGQVVAWRQLAEMGNYDFSNAAIALFFLITGIHVLHLLGGLVVWVNAVFKLRRGGTRDDVRQIVGICTTYWHYLLGVWLVLFFLLFTGTNLEMIMQLIGHG